LYMALAASSMINLVFFVWMVRPSMPSVSQSSQVAAEQGALAADEQRQRVALNGTGVGVDSELAKRNAVAGDEALGARADGELGGAAAAAAKPTDGMLAAPLAADRDSDGNPAAASDVEEEAALQGPPPDQHDVGAEVKFAPSAYNGPMLIDPTQGVRKLTEESIVWSRLGPCRFGRSLLAPWLPHRACQWDDCLRCRGGYCLLQSLLQEPPLPEVFDRKCPEPSGGQVSGNGSQPLVSFVWTVHNRATVAANALLCVFRTAHEVPSAEFVVYDDGSTDDMTALVSLMGTLQREFGARVVALSSPPGQTQGYAVACSTALRQAKGKYAVLLHADVCPLPGWLGVLVRTIETFPGAGIVGPMMVSPQGEVLEMGGSVFQHGRAALRERFTAPDEVMLLHATAADFAGGACLLLDRQLFLSQSPFGPQSAPAAFEAADAALTMRAAGYLTVVQPLSVVVRAKGVSYTASETEEQMRIDQLGFYNRHKDQLDLHCPPPDACTERENVERAIRYDAFQRQGSQILIMDFSVPEPDRDSGSLRMYEIMQIVVDRGHAVSFQPECVASLARYVAPLLAMGIHVLQPGSLKAMAAELEATGGSAGREWQCPWAAVIVCRRSTFRSQERHLRALCPSVPIVFDTVDLHYVRERRSVEAAFASGDQSKVFVMDSFWDPVATPRAKLESLLREAEDMEVGYMASSDYVLVVSTAEHRIVAERVGADKVRILTNIYPEPDRERGATLKGRQGGLFVGSMCHTPNLDASKFIMREVFGPATHAGFPPGFMHFVWSGTQKCKALVGELLDEARGHPLVTLHLDVSDEELAQLHMRTQFFLGAIRVGAGVKGKLCQALFYGLPIIGSRAATEGMRMQDEENVLEANSVDEYRVQIKRLTTDADLWHRLRRSGFDLVQRHFGRGNARAVLDEIFTELKVVPRVSPAARGPRRAAPAWACPLQSGLQAAGSGRRLTRTKKGRGPQRLRSPESASCPYARDSTRPAIVPTELLKDRLLGDERLEDRAAPTQAVHRAASGLCPNRTTPLPEHPFIFYHMEHCNGDVLRPLMASSVATSANVAIPGVRPAWCSLAWNVDEATAASCAADLGHPNAILYFGSFSPLRLSRVSQGTCFVMLRRPLSRAMSHYQAVLGSSTAADARRFASMGESDLNDAVWATGTGLYMSRYLGCKGTDCPGIDAHKVVTEARQQLGRCHVGIAELTRETMSYLQLLLPWFAGSFTILDKSAAADPLRGRTIGKEEIARLDRHFQGDNLLYEDGYRAFVKQMNWVWSCDSVERFEGDAPSLSREMRKIARKVIKSTMAVRVQMSTCLERRKVCSSHTVDARSCRCSELVEYLDD